MRTNGKQIEDPPCIVCGAPESGHDLGCALRVPDLYVIWRDDNGVVLCDKCIENEPEPNSFDPLDGEEAYAFHADCAMSTGPVMCNGCLQHIPICDENAPGKARHG